ncbi:hypothetical protein CesoFtcFv8_008172 [Champsocephalus esox]|uniref:Uncharacterized protein n=1 Tax=Champsocephalus esox TaxID=159716 RepID=A0AAN8C7I0_9TELE|nr:hypothetical protein CesoFtcFv8_008172 [Champsocephalus esox]
MTFTGISVPPDPPLSSRSVDPHFHPALPPTSIPPRPGAATDDTAPPIQLEPIYPRTDIPKQSDQPVDPNTRPPPCSSSCHHNYTTLTGRFIL